MMQRGIDVAHAEGDGDAPRGIALALLLCLPLWAAILIVFLLVLRS